MELVISNCIFLKKKKHEKTIVADVPGKYICFCLSGKSRGKLICAQILCGFQLMDHCLYKTLSQELFCY